MRINLCTILILSMNDSHRQNCCIFFTCFFLGIIFIRLELGKQDTLCPNIHPDCFVQYLYKIAIQILRSLFIQINRWSNVLCVITEAPWRPSKSKIWRWRGSIVYFDLRGSFAPILYCTVQPSYFHQIGPLGQFGLVVAMSVCCHLFVVVPFSYNSPRGAKEVPGEQSCLPPWH